MRRMAIGFAAVLLLAGPVAAQEGPKLTIGGATYTKWLWGTMRNQGAMYSYAEADPPPGNGNVGGYGDSGQASELELFINAKLSRQVEVKSRIHSRFNQNHWTNFGGFGGGDPSGTACLNGDCGELDPRSNQYVKLRGVTVVLTPGYSWIDSATIGSNDFGQFDPFVIGKVRYIDRDNASGLLFQGSALGRGLNWNAARISLPRLWAGPGYSTGSWHATDATYGGQVKVKVSDMLDFGAIGAFTLDNEVDPRDFDFNNGRSLDKRFRNGVVGARAGVHAGAWADLRGAYYHANSKTYSDGGVSPTYGSVTDFGPVSLGVKNDWAGLLDWTTVDPLGIGLSWKAQAFFIGADYNSIMAARRESDVLLMEGYDATWASPGASNDRYRAYWRYRGACCTIQPRSNIGYMGYGGWSGTRQQLATINVDNSFMDFDEPLAESAVGWKGITLAPAWTRGPLELSAEYTYLGYDTNWQAWGRPNDNVTQTPYPGAETDAGVLSNYRSNFSPFRDKWTQFVVVRAKYLLDVGKGLDTSLKVKYVREKDNRMTDARYLPYDATGARNNYAGTFSTADIYVDPPTVSGFTASGTAITGPQWKPFRSLADDDRDLKYWSFTATAGYQVLDELYLALTYAKYLADLRDGTSAFGAYKGEHPMAGGKHDKNQVVLHAKYVLAGIELGFEGQYNFGDWKPDYGAVCTSSGQTDCYVVQRIETAQQSSDVGYPVGTRGWFSRNGSPVPGAGTSGNPTFNPFDKQQFTEWRLKAFMKAQF